MEKNMSENLYDLTKDLSILYVEDDEMLRQKTSILFKELFFEVDEAQNGQIGLDMYKNRVEEEPYDLVISDISMPKMDGIEMANNILRVNPEQVIFIFSAFNDSHILVDLMGLGVTHYIQKPLKLSQFNEKLTKICKEVNQKKKERKLKQEYHEFEKRKELEKKNSTDSILSAILQVDDSELIE
jgi:YesN/AraC family two-component response regulator